MKSWRVATVMMSMLLGISAFAANPFLDAKDDKPVSAKFQGNEWGDEIPQDEIPLTAQVVTTRIANMPWGAIFKIEFVNVKSRAPQPRKIQPKYFVVTDDLIALVNEEDIPAAIKRISTLDKPPEFDPGEIYGITSGSFDHDDGSWKTTIRLKGDICMYDASHACGHFKQLVWKKGVGLVEYASGYGAHGDGYGLKRAAKR